jgi:hypothetical protein
MSSKISQSSYELILYIVQCKHFYLIHFVNMHKHDPDPCDNKVFDYAKPLKVR